MTCFPNYRNCLFMTKKFHEGLSLWKETSKELE